MEQQSLLLRVVEILNRLQIPHMVTGSYAVNFYGVPRLTHDIDLVILLRLAGVDTLAEQFPASFYVDADSIRQAVLSESMFNVIDLASGLKIDFWILKKDDYDPERFRRRRAAPLFGAQVWMPSPEDVILSKLLWYKQARTDKHHFDARGVWDLQKGSLDRSYLDLWAARLTVKTWLEQLEKT